MIAQRPLTIRTATDADLPAILDLYEEAGFGSGKRLDPDRAKAQLARIATYPDYRVFVATEAESPPLGTYALLIMDNIAHNGRPLAVVEQVSVTRARQGQGIGKLMMHHAMAEAREKSCYKLQLSS
ncbi:MAG: GNAT family N-acetyltransferase, partial [Hyphomicrobiaceae bacterium]